MSSKHPLNSASPPAGGKPAIAQKPRLKTPSEMAAFVRGPHVQTESELLDAGISLGARYKLYVQHRNNQVYERAHATWKEVMLDCDSGHKEACKLIEKNASDLVSYNTEVAEIGKFGSSKEGEAFYDDYDLHSGTSPALVQFGTVGSILDNMFGGAGASNPENFEGGNQGSFFNFMYPSDKDYPWACVCDDNQYKLWEKKEVKFVPCRNQVDMSSQNVISMCDPQNHKLNSANGFFSPYNFAIAVGAAGFIAVNAAL